MLSDGLDLNESLRYEIEALEATLTEEDELALEIVNSNLRITTRIAPKTASDTSRQYVGLYLKIEVNKALYPDEEKPLKVDVNLVRGLEETQVNDLLKLLKTKMDDFSPGDPILYDLMDICKDYLTDHNYPTCPCSICLYHIVEEDSFVKTPCFHYFHSACFGRYLQNFKPISDEYEDDFSRFRPKKEKKPENILPCPVCREDVPKESFDIRKLLMEKDGALLSTTNNNEDQVRPLEEWQSQMKALLEVQKAKGGLISNKQS